MKTTLPQLATLPDAEKPAFLEVAQRWKPTLDAPDDELPPANEEEE
jgi:hypothetical protein